MSSIQERLRKNRESKVTVAGHVFIIRRPTELQWAEEVADLNARSLLKYLVGWDGVKEIDIINGGDPHAVPFDPELAAEWLSDRVDVLNQLGTAIVESFARHLEKRDGVLKN